MDINFADIEKLIKIAENANIGELEITSGQQTIRITCQAPQSSSNNNPQLTQSFNQPTSHPQHSSVPITPNVIPTPTPEGEKVQKNTTTGTAITSPMVGTFYRKASPDTPAFVEVGSLVQANQTLCIIEAMKIMHEVKAEKSGKISAILVEDGAMVEYGEPLFTME